MDNRCVRLRLAASVVAVAAPQVLAAQPPATELIARMSEIYSSMRSSLMMRAEIWRRVSWGDFWREGRRRYRLIQQNDDVRLDLFGDEKVPAVTRMRRNGNLLLYTAAFREFSEQPETDPSTQPIRDVLERFRATLYARFADLAASKPTILSSRSVQLKLRDRKMDCLHIKLRSADGAARTWSGGIWVDRDSALVWQASMVTRDESAQLVEERVTWQQIVTGPAVPLEELRWQPPPGTERLASFPYTLPQ